MTSHEALAGFPTQQVVENRREHTLQNGEKAFLKPTECRSVNEMPDLYTLSKRVPWFGYFCPTDTRSAHVLTWIFMIRWPRQIRPLAKKDWRTLVCACQNTSWVPVYQQIMLWIHETICPMMWRPISLNVYQLFWLKCVFIDAHFKFFDPVCWTFAWETQCRATTYQTIVFPFIPET